MVDSSLNKRISIQFINLFLILLIVIIVVGIPFAAKSLYDEVVSNASDADRFVLVESGRLHGYTQVEIITKELDPVNKTIKAKVVGYHKCDAICEDYALKLHISSFYNKIGNENRVPESFIIAVPHNNEEFEQEIELPVSGVVYDYPYDRYIINTAIAVEKIKDGQSTFLTGGDNHVNIMLDEQTSRLQDAAHYPISDLATITTLHPPVNAFSSEFERPLYVKYIVTLLVFLLIITTTATVFLSDFSKLITGSAGIILGVWGARSLLLGNLPADVTIIDIILTLIVIGTLISVATKAILYVRKRMKE